ncbi:MAG: NAD(P)H-dependent oxidoreductase [Pseudomonadota bacterium]
MKFLRIDASARRDGAHTRDLMDAFISGLDGKISVQTRDLLDPIPHVDEAWLTANFTSEDDRHPEHQQALTLSDTLIAEIEAADTLLIGLPVYNFGVPSALKAWIDQVCRARRTFAYSENGPVGLLKGKRAIVFYVSGGTPMGSDIDFASGYLRHVLGFIGITDVQMIAADQHMMNDQAVEHARAAAHDLAASFAKAAA